MMLLDDFAVVSQTRSADALRCAAERLTGDLDFERYSLQLVTPQEDGGQHWSTIANVPVGYIDTWRRPGLGKSDPVMQHAKASSLPLYWGRETYQRACNLPKWEAQEPWGYGTGFIVAAHLPNGRHVLACVERRKPLQDSAEHLTKKLATFQLFATCAIDACEAVFAKDAPIAMACPLTRRELEVLQRTLQGKTAWEVGQILGISEGTAALHVNNATRKLGAANKWQAAMKALRLGWIREIA